MFRTHRPRLLLALTATTALVLAGCGGDDKQADQPESQQTAEPQTMEVRSPLTGLTVKKSPGHPIVAVKIDNSSSAAPQVGLGKADLVVEELVEGGITRLAVFFDQTIPRTVGPVRSMRATDIGIVQPADGVLVASGGAPQTVARVRDAQIRTFTEGATGYYREPGRYAPYNLFVKLPELVKTLKNGQRPESYLPFGDADEFPSGRKASGLDATFSGSTTTRWAFQGGKYVNTNSFAAEGDRFQPDTVLVLRVRVGDAGYRDPAGNPVPETHLTGKGQAMVFHGGRLVRGTWSKDGYDADLTLRTKAGELKLPPGKVWIELVPAKDGNVTVTK